MREVGDFVAHRNQREKGLVTQKARDIFTSFDSWLRITVMRQPFTLPQIRKTAEANLRNATDAQLSERLNMKRAVVKSVLAQALKKLERGQKATARERKTIDYLGGAFIWNPAFTDADLVEDLLLVLVETGLLRRAEHNAFRALSDYIALYVITLLHGSVILLEHGNRAQLMAGFDNDQGQLEVKAMLTMADIGKPVSAPTCLVWTSLVGSDHCVPALLEDSSQWLGPLEIDDEGKLTPLG